MSNSNGTVGQNGESCIAVGLTPELRALSDG